MNDNHPLSTIIIHPTFNCNLRCKYCWEEGKRTNTVISEDTLYCIANFIEELSEQSNENTFTISWMGGEPLLMGMEFYDRARSIFQSVCNPDFFFRTNMTLIDDEWGEYFKKNNILVGGSLDGPKKIHDKQRSGSYDAVMRGIEIIKKCGCRFDGVACTMTEESTRDMKKLFGFFMGLKIPFVLNNEICGMSPIRLSFNYQQLYYLWNEYDRPAIFPRLWEVQEKIKKIMDGGSLHDCSKGGCGAGWAIFDPEGGCHLCNHDNCSMNTYFGNVTESSPRDLWDSSERRDYLNSVRELRTLQCGECLHRFVCNGACMDVLFKLGGEYDPFCGMGYHTYEMIIKSLGYTIQDYTEAVSRLSS